MLGGKHRRRATSEAPLHQESHWAHSHMDVENGSYNARRLTRNISTWVLVVLFSCFLIFRVVTQHTSHFALGKLYILDYNSQTTHEPPKLLNNTHPKPWERRCPELERTAYSQFSWTKVAGPSDPMQHARLAFAILDVDKRGLLVINGTHTSLLLDPNALSDGHIVRCLRGFRLSFSFEPIQQMLAETNSTVALIMNFHAADVFHQAYPMPLPIFSYCKVRGGTDFLFPRPYMNEFLEYQASEPMQVPWEKKEAKAIFRGALTNPIRERLWTAMHSSKLGEEVLDVGITSTVLTPQNPNLTLAPLMLIKYQFMGYRYIINADGHACADRFLRMLHHPQVTLMHEKADVVARDFPAHQEVMEEFWYPQLKPWKHYVPYKSDASDLVEKVEYLRNHDEFAQQMMKDSTTFANSINTDTLQCYFLKLVAAYRKIQPDGLAVLKEIREAFPDLVSHDVWFCNSRTTKCEHE